MVGIEREIRSIVNRDKTRSSDAQIIFEVDDLMASIAVELNEGTGSRGTDQGIVVNAQGGVALGIHRNKTISDAFARTGNEEIIIDQRLDDAGVDVDARCLKAATEPGAEDIGVHLGTVEGSLIGPREEAIVMKGIFRGIVPVFPIVKPIVVDHQAGHRVGF